MCCVSLVSRRSAATMASTQTQWRIVVESVWVTAQAVRQFISHLMKKEALVSATQGVFSTAGNKLNYLNIRHHAITKLCCNAKQTTY